MPRHRYTFQEVYDLFKDRGCQLLSTSYPGYNEPLEYVCHCGRVANTYLRKFLYSKGCSGCHNERVIESNRNNHGGLLYLQTEEFKNKRKNTVKRKYGVDNVSQAQFFKDKKHATCMRKYGSNEFMSSEIGKKRVREATLKKYGVEFTMQIPSAREKFKETLMRKYGVPSLAYLSRCASKQSQKLFWELYRLLPDEYQKHAYFADLNHEYVLTYEGKHYKYDLVVTSLKIAIEFNGTNFHPRIDQDENEIGWCAFHPNLSVKDARIYEDTKKEAIEKRDYKVFYFWDTNLKNWSGLINMAINCLLIGGWGKFLAERDKAAMLIT